LRNYLFLLFTAYALAAFGQQPLVSFQQALDENKAEKYGPIGLLLDDNLLLNAQACSFGTWRRENPAPHLNQALTADFDHFLSFGQAYYRDQINAKWANLTPMEQYALHLFIEEAIAYCQDFSMAREDQYLADLAKEVGSLPNYANSHAVRLGGSFNLMSTELFVRYGPEDFYKGNLKHPKPYFARQPFRRLQVFIYRRAKAGVPIENMQRFLESLQKLMPALKEQEYTYTRYDEKGRLKEEGTIRNGKPYGRCRHYGYPYGSPNTRVLVVDWQTDKKGRLKQLYFTDPSAIGYRRCYLQYKRGKLQTYQIKVADPHYPPPYIYYLGLDSLSMDLRKKKVQLFRKNRVAPYTLSFKQAPERFGQFIWDLKELQEDIVLDLRVCEQENICFPEEELSNADRVVELYIAPKSPAEFVEKWKPLLKKFSRLKKVYVYLDKGEDWPLYQELLDQGIKWELY